MYILMRCRKKFPLAGSIIIAMVYAQAIYSVRLYKCVYMMSSFTYKLYMQYNDITCHTKACMQYKVV